MKNTEVLLVGSNPSERSLDNSAFHVETKSRQTIDTWFSGKSVNLKFENVSSSVTNRNRSLNVSEIRACLPNLKQRLEGYNIIVAVGKTAVKALQMLEIEHFEMWHPSGLCRKWNDKQASAEKITALHRYIDERRQETNGADQSDSWTI